MKDRFGRAWRQKPLRERLLPWPVYFVMSVVMLAIALYLLTSADQPLRRVAVPLVVLAFLLVPPLAYWGVMSYRLRR